MNIEHKNETIQRPEEVAKLMRAVLMTDDEIQREKEHFWVIMVDTRNCVKNIELVSLGTVNSSLVHPREIFRRAIQEGACSIVIAHNHPSGDTTPSEEDLAVTKRLVKSGEILDIKILDHVIINHKDKKFYYLIMIII